LTKLTYLTARFIIFDMAVVETPSCLATSAKATPCVFTNPMGMVGHQRPGINVGFGFG
jgi:hypothetical protein